ncbi:hypothetical protein PIB30_066832 [Stylosanthes scabra]|uniref:Uncharacterized protein n=1 Tax=Stylosanthes scabra TaxID=79078 RepID=A0ABU6WKQ1_9FABA|nr:hypothetical protein [Stylosanthes scabra]
MKKTNQDARTSPGTTPWGRTRSRYGTTFRFLANSVIVRAYDSKRLRRWSSSLIPIAAVTTGLTPIDGALNSFGFGIRDVGLGA